MTDQTPHLQLPIMAQGQAQKHITYNEALTRLDAVIQLSVVSSTTQTPPNDAEVGTRFIIPDGAGGIWPGEASQIASAIIDGWQILTPQTGWLAWVEDASKLVVFDGSDWTDALTVPDLQNLPSVGVGTTADALNRFSVSADAVLFTHSGAGHQVKVKKSGATETASVLLQSNWQGRAEIGLVGNDDLVVKVSPDGQNFITALQINHANGQINLPNGATGLTPAAFGDGPMINTNFSAARTPAITNGLLTLNDQYNWPAGLTRNNWQTPNLPASGEHIGHFETVLEWDEFIPVDPHGAYKLRGYIRQQGHAGDFTAYPNENRHQQGIGVACYDADFNRIEARHYTRFHSGPHDSITILTQPLAPGDTQLHLEWAGGWNDTDPNPTLCGVMILFYKTSGGQFFDRYTRHVGLDLFDPSGVNKTNGTITLKTPWPASLGNPQAPDGVWPAGTLLANTGGGMNQKFCAMPLTVVPQTDQWFQATGYIGGVDRSGVQSASSFAPGTCYIRPCVAPSFSNRPGGMGDYPDTTADQTTWIAGLTLTPDPTVIAAPGSNGAILLRRQAPTDDLQSVTMVDALPSLIQV